MSPSGIGIDTDDLLVELVASEDPVLQTSCVASALDCPPDTVCEELDHLEGEGLAASKTIGGKRVWWATPAGHQYAKESGRIAVSQ